MTGIRWLRRALRDLDYVYACVATDNAAAAGRLIDQIQTGTAMLCNAPELGRAGRVAGTRELAMAGTPFIVVYRTHAAQIIVLAILHGARRWPRGF